MRHFNFAAALLVVAVAVTVVVAGFAPAAALAAGTGAPAALTLAPTIVDLSAIVSSAIQLLGAVAAAFVGKMAHDAHVRAYLGRIIEHSVKFAVESVEHVDWTRLDVRNALVAAAANYVIQSAPKALRTFGIDRNRLERMVLARLFDLDGRPGRWDPDADGDGDGAGGRAFADVAADRARPAAP
jgi:hypothetical protein